MDKYGIDINSQIPRNEAIEKYLLEVFHANYGGFMSTALADQTKRRNLTIFFWPYTGFDKDCGGSANYCVKERRFDFISYSVKTKRGAYYSKRFLI